MDLYSLSSYQFELPEELVAQFPTSRRDESRLMVVDRSTGQIQDMIFKDLPSLFGKGDSFVFNNTKVIPARLQGKRSTGGSVELLLLEEKSEGLWKALARPFRKLKRGDRLFFADTFDCMIEELLSDGVVIVRFNNPASFEKDLFTFGKLPLPHYIRRETERDTDLERYQTVFAEKPGAVAAPTAGLHFTDALLTEMRDKEMAVDYITLHVGPGTFKPVVSPNIQDHKMHEERFFIDEQTAHHLNRRPEGKRQICVGTTCCRTLESNADFSGVIRAGSGVTDIFIYPGYQFKYVRHLLTNFHVPGSTLLMLVAAFAGYDLMMEAYARAVKERYRFFSYGDAMLIL